MHLENTLYFSHAVNFVLCLFHITMCLVSYYCFDKTFNVVFFVHAIVWSILDIFAIVILKSDLLHPIITFVFAFLVFSAYCCAELLVPDSNGWFNFQTKNNILILSTCAFWYWCSATIVIHLFMCHKMFRSIKKDKLYEESISTIDEQSRLLPDCDQKCCICLNALLLPNVLLSTTKCRHTFHTVCLEKWYASTPKKTCPSCRLV